MGGRLGKSHSQPCFLAYFDTTYRLTVKLHDEAGHLVAHCPLPYDFIIKQNGNRVSNPRRQAHAPAQQQVLRPGSNLPSVTSLEPILPDPLASSQLDSSHMGPVLQTLAPSKGPTSGGLIILISGINFPPPTHQSLYVKFGNLDANTV